MKSYIIGRSRCYWRIEWRPTRQLSSQHLCRHLHLEIYGSLNTRLYSDPCRAGRWCTSIVPITRKGSTKVRRIFVGSMHIQITQRYSRVDKSQVHWPWSSICDLNYKIYLIIQWSKVRVIHLFLMTRIKNFTTHYAKIKMWTWCWTILHKMDG